MTGAAGGIGRAVCDVVVGCLGGTAVAIDVDGPGLSSLADALGSGLITVEADLSDLGNVRSTALSVRERFPEIDVLVNNAGMSYTFADEEVGAAGTTAQGHDLLFGVNYLSHVLLTELLRPCLERARGGGRIAFVTSGFHQKVDGSMLVPTDPKIDDGGEGRLWDSEAAEMRRAGGEAGSGAASISPPASRGAGRGRWRSHAGRAYANSKLAQIWHARSLARDLAGDPSASPPITVACACPSWAGTGIAGEDGRSFLSRFAYPAERGGAGITSVLNAMLRTNDDLGESVLSSDGTRYVGNSLTAEILTQWPIHTSRLTAEMGWRDGIVSAFSIVILATQRWLYDDFILQKTSCEANDVDGQNALHRWSMESVRPWLQKEGR